MSIRWIPAAARPLAIYGSTMSIAVRQHDMMVNIKCVFDDYWDDVLAWVVQQSQTTVYDTDYWFHQAMSGQHEFPISIVGWNRRKQQTTALRERLESYRL